MFSEILNNKKILDFGCGKGGFLRKLKENNISDKIFITRVVFHQWTSTDMHFQNSREATKYLVSKLDRHTSKNVKCEDKNLLNCYALWLS